MALKTGRIEVLFNEGYSLADLLPYEECIDGIFIMTDGSLGKVWQLDFIESEGKTEEALSVLVAQWESLLTRMPNAQLASQIILSSDSSSKEKLTQYLDYFENQTSIKDFAEGKLTHVEAHKGELFTHQSQTFVLKKLTLYVTLRFFPDWVHPSLWEKTLDALQGKNKVDMQIKSQIVRHQIEFKNYSDLIECIFQSAGVKSRIVEAEELATWVYALLNPKRSQSIAKASFSQQESIRNQIVFNSPKVSGQGFHFENTKMRIVSLKELPKETRTGMFTREFYEGSRFCFLDIPQEFIMVINFTVPGSQEALAHLNMQKTFAFMHQENFLGDKSIEAVEKKKELDETIAQMFQGGGKIINARIHWIIRSFKEEEAESGCNQLLSALNRLGCEGIKEDLIGASLFLTCLPLNFDPYYEQFIRRARRLSSANAADMLPVFGSFQGHRTPAQMYYNRRGEVVFIDFFDSNINPHGIVIGASGAGKSFFINDFILQNERLGAHFFVLDKGDSYKKLNLILNGQYMNFDLNQPVTINPFVNPPTPENCSFLLSLLSQMASGGDERDRLMREEEGLLHKAIMTAYEKKKQDQEVTLSSVVEILKDNAFNDTYGINSLMGPTLALRLTPFTKKGPYGQFFDGQNQFEIKGRFTVFELANLSAYPDLQVAVLLNLMFYMTNFVSLPELKPQRKYLLIDEAWSLLKVKNTADFITNAFKTFRKFRCSVVAITQEMADLTRQESGIAIVANASNKIFLKQESTLIDSLKGGLSLEEGTIKALKTVETVKRKFSEGYVITDSSCGVIRLIPDPFLYWAASSEPKDNEYLFSKVERCQGDLIEAIKICSKERPYGV